MASKALVAAGVSLAAQLDAAESLAALADEADAVIPTIRGAATSAMTAAQVLVIDSDAGAELAAELIRKIAEVADNLETLRTGMTGPINAALKAINLVFKPLTADLDTAKRQLKGKIGAWIETKRRLAEEKVHKVRQLQEELGIEPTAEAAPVMLPDGAHVRREIDFEISDLKLIPDRYWALDEQKVRFDLRKGVEIPGIRVIVREQVIVR